MTGFKSVELEDRSDVHGRIFENNPQQQQKMSNEETLLPFTEFQGNIVILCKPTVF